MDTRQVEYFVAVAEELNFTRAANRLYAAQSTISAGIRALERHLGAQLFERSTKAVALTPAGAALLPEARQLLEGVDRVRSSVAADPAAIRGRLRIGTFISLDAVRLPEVLGDFHARHPLVDLQLVASVTGSSGLVEEIRHGRADVAFVGLPAESLVEFRVVPLVASGFVAILPMGHPQAERSEVAIVDLAAERWIDSPPGYASRIAIDRVFSSRGLDRVVFAEVADASEMPKLVAAGLGVAAVPQLIYHPSPGVVSRPVVPRELKLVVSVVSRRNPSPAARAFLSVIAEK
jgi:DNA-binding transcriptional LysR family regulator